MRANEFIIEAPLTLDQQISDVVERLDDLEDLFKKQDQTPEEEQEFIRLNKKLEQLQKKKKEQNTTKAQANPKKPKNPNERLLKDIRKYMNMSMDLKDPEYFDNIDGFIRTLPRIKRDCQPYLKQVKDIYGMYRGLEYPYGETPLVVSKTARLTDRKPRDTDIDVHNAINRFFNKKFGHPYRNGVFVTGNENEASVYGDTFSIFPIGKFDFLWSPDIGDLTEHFFQLNSNSSNRYDLESIMKEVKEANWKTDDLNAAIKSHHEIMLWTPKYYAINLLGVNDRAYKLIAKYLKS